MKQLIWILSLCFFCLTHISCNYNSSPDSVTETRSNRSSTVSLANWNVQTFFDGQNDGCEYSEFQKGSLWSKEKYTQRLSRLCSVITSLNADIFVLEEIENENVIYDLSNYLAGSNWDNSKMWNYSCFLKEKNSAIGCAVISRYPLMNIKSHSMDIRTCIEKQPSERPVLQVSVDVNGKELLIFVNHWKSKSGGEQETEIWRDWQESLLSLRLRKLEAFSEKNVILCGDFNRNAGDFICSFEGRNLRKNTIFRGAGFGESVNSFLQNQWFNQNGDYICETGSYYYQNNWEYIDNIFSSGNTKVSGFTPKAQSPWASSINVPVGYKIYTGKGYSDHLPVMCYVTL